MTLKPILFSLAFSVVCFSSSVAQSRKPTEPVSGQPQTIPYCDLLRTHIDPAREVRVRAIYRLGYEWADVYSLRCPDAILQVDFSDDWKTHSKKSVWNLIDKDEGTYGVTFVGTLEGVRAFGAISQRDLKFKVTVAESAQRLGTFGYAPSALPNKLRSRVAAFEGLR